MREYFKSKYTDGKLILSCREKIIFTYFQKSSLKSSFFNSFHLSLQHDLKCNLKRRQNIHKILEKWKIYYVKYLFERFSFFLNKCFLAFVQIFYFLENLNFYVNHTEKKKYRKNMRYIMWSIYSKVIFSVFEKVPPGVFQIFNFLSFLNFYVNHTEKKK